MQEAGKKKVVATPRANSAVLVFSETCDNSFPQTIRFHIIFLFDLFHFNFMYSCYMLLLFLI